MSEQDQERMKVLLIDDEKEVVDFFGKAFANFKHVRFFATTLPREGVAIAKAEKPRVVLMDLRMPWMSGEEVLKELKPALPGTRFIVMTGWDDGRTRERLSELGADAFFGKPVDLERVVAKVFEFLMSKEPT